MNRGPRGGAGMRTQRRRQMMIDQRVQGALLRRVALYWLLAVSGTGLFTWVAYVWSGPGGGPLTLGHVLAGAVGTVVLLPAIVVDVLRVSHRFVGPIHTLRNALKRRALGDRPPSLSARDDDFWTDLLVQSNEFLLGPSAEQQLGSAPSFDPKPTVLQGVDETTRP